MEDFYTSHHRKIKPADLVEQPLLEVRDTEIPKNLMPNEWMCANCYTINNSTYDSSCKNKNCNLLNPDINKS